MPMEAAGAKVPAIPEGGLLSAHLFRVDSKFHFEDRVELQVAWQLASRSRPIPRSREAHH